MRILLIVITVHFILLEIVDRLIYFDCSSYQERGTPMLLYHIPYAGFSAKIQSHLLSICLVMHIVCFLFLSLEQ